jgi:molybdenum cofactor cytidylyltransferase
MSGFVSGLVLAAGTASRLGVPKQLLPWRGTTLLEWVVRQAEASPLDEVIVVVGHESAALRHKVTFERARIVEAPDYHEGCSASIRAGLEAVSPNAEAAVLVLGDQPGIQPAALESVIEEWRRSEAAVVRVSYRGRPGHPVLLSRTIFAEVRQLRGDKGVWRLLEAHPEWVREIAMDLPSPADINRWEDYTKLSSSTESS